MARTILLTGVTRGLGRALVDEFAMAGHTVLGCGRSRKAILELREEFRPPHDFGVVDVSNDRQVEAWAARLLSSAGAPDLLVNNAAVINENAPLWEVSDDEFSRVIDINIKGVVHVIRHFVPAMIARQNGVIVNITSGWGRSADAMVAPYCATKWALEGLTLALAQELPGGMAALTLNPGVIDTEMLRTCFGESASAHQKPVKWARRAAPFLLKLGPHDNGKQLSAPGAD